LIVIGFQKRLPWFTRALQAHAGPEKTGQAGTLYNNFCNYGIKVPTEIAKHIAG
jgi:hypothetical protein